MNDRSRDAFDLDELLHPAQAFERPSDVVNDPDLTLNEKRAILAAWASDACAVEAAPELRAAPRGEPVRFDEIMDALRTLDRQASVAEDTRRYRRAVRRRPWSRRGPAGPGDQGSALH
jgi:hypothetical protein